MDESAKSLCPAERAPEEARTYRLGPFCFHSELALPELHEARANDAKKVVLQLGAVQAQRPDLHRLDEFCAVSPTEYLLDIPAVARYLVQEGERVTVDVYPEARDADVRGYLLGSVFGALCHQGGLLPLHASAVLGAGGVTAFLGDSGAGKSTTAAFLERRGYPVVSDDICLLNLAAGDLSVIPVAGWLKLWQESFDQLGESPDGNTRVFSQSDKYRRYLAAEELGALELTNVVFLEQDAGLAAPVLERASAAQAVAGVMRLTYLAYVSELNGSRAAHLAQVSQVLRGARAWRLRRPWGWDALPAALALVERHLLKDGS